MASEPAQAEGPAGRTSGAEGRASRRFPVGRKTARKVSYLGMVAFAFDYDPVTESYQDFRSRWFANLGVVIEGLEESEMGEESRRAIGAELFDHWYDYTGPVWASTGEIVAQHRETIHELRSGDALYSLRQPVRGAAKAASSGRWLFEVEEFSPTFVGEGASVAEARTDWRQAVHAAFQSLVRLRPLRMSEEQKQEWDVLKRLIDVEHYWRTTPVRLRELGFVSGVRRGPCQITWLDGMLVEDVTLEQMPRESAGFAQGQWFEAIVEREPDTHALRRVTYVQPVDPLPEMSEDELKTWYQSLRSADSLPPSESDWSTL